MFGHSGVTTGKDWMRQVTCALLIDKRHRMLLSVVSLMKWLMRIRLY